MDKKTKSIKRNLANKFWDQTYPELEEKVETIRYPYFFKIRGRDMDWDYYPGAQKLNIRRLEKDGNWSNTWTKLDHDKVLDYFLGQ
jgi:hypothetical protein